MKLPNWIRSIGSAFHLCEPGHRVNNFTILFGHQAAGKGEHGALTGTWVSEGARRVITIPFFFESHSTPPKIEPKMMEELFHHARCVGIDPHSLCGYQTLMQPRAARR